MSKGRGHFCLVRRPSCKI